MFAAPIILAPNPENNPEEDEEAPEDNIAPSPDVFSYFLLTAPSERKRHGHFTVDAFTSYLLVFVVLFMQCILLYCVWHKVIGKNVSWRDGIMNTGNSGNMAWNVAEPKHESTCNDGNSLCTLENGVFTCAPPSVQLIGRWDELDTDKDGVWTRSEVMRSREALKCKFAVDPVEVFDVLGLLLKEREKYIWLHPDVKKGEAIHKDYFTYIMGDVAMCGYRSGDMCGNLVQRGFFDAALMNGNIPRIGTTIRSALEYCHSLLDTGGLCERTLPSKYSSWKIESVQECRSPTYEEFVYEDPNNGMVKSMLAVDYKARQNYEVAKTPVFKLYKTCIILIWMLLIVSQLRDAIKVFTWISQIPTTDDTASSSQFPVSDKSSEIRHIRDSHRFCLFIVSLVRMCILLILLYVGLNFLARQTDYIGLLLDGVALVFIVEIEEIVYTRVIRQDVRSDWEGRDPIPLTKVGLFAGQPDVLDLVWFFFLLIFAIAFLWYYTATLVEPLYDALECACLSQGDKCREAHAFSFDFWAEYWAVDVPRSIQQITQLRNNALSLSASSPSSLERPSRFVGNLLQSHLHGAPSPSSLERPFRFVGNLLQKHVNVHLP